jgi:hypothetical protein
MQKEYDEFEKTAPLGPRRCKHCTGSKTFSKTSVKEEAAKFKENRQKKINGAIKHIEREPIPPLFVLNNVDMYFKHAIFWTIFHQEDQLHIPEKPTDPDVPTCAIISTTVNCLHMWSQYSQLWCANVVILTDPLQMPTKKYDQDTIIVTTHQIVCEWYRNCIVPNLVPGGPPPDNVWNVVLVDEAQYLTMESTFTQQNVESHNYLTVQSRRCLISYAVGKALSPQYKAEMCRIGNKVSTPKTDWLSAAEWAKSDNPSMKAFMKKCSFEELDDPCVLPKDKDWATHHNKYISRLCFNSKEFQSFKKMLGTNVLAAYKEKITKPLAPTYRGPAIYSIQDPMDTDSDDSPDTEEEDDSQSMYTPMHGSRDHDFEESRIPPIQITKKRLNPSTDPKRDPLMKSDKTLSPAKRRKAIKCNDSGDSGGEGSGGQYRAPQDQGTRILLVENSLETRHYLLTSKDPQIPSAFKKTIDLADTGDVFHINTLVGDPSDIFDGFSEFPLVSQNIKNRDIEKTEDFVQISDWLEKVTYNVEDIVLTDPYDTKYDVILFVQRFTVETVLLKIIQPQNQEILQYYIDLELHPLPADIVSGILQHGIHQVYDLVRGENFLSGIMPRLMVYTQEQVESDFDKWIQSATSVIAGTKIEGTCGRRWSTGINLILPNIERICNDLCVQQSPDLNQSVLHNIRERIMRERDELRRQLVANHGPSGEDEKEFRKLHKKHEKLKHGRSFPVESSPTSVSPSSPCSPKRYTQSYGHTNVASSSNDKSPTSSSSNLESDSSVSVSPSSPQNALELPTDLRDMQFQTPTAQQRYVNHDLPSPQSSSEESSEEDYDPPEKTQYHPQMNPQMVARLRNMQDDSNTAALLHKVQNLDLSPVSSCSGSPEGQMLVVRGQKRRSESPPLQGPSSSKAAKCAIETLGTMQQLTSMASKEAKEYVQSKDEYFIFPGQYKVNLKGYVWAWSKTRGLCRRSNTGGFLRGTGEASTGENSQRPFYQDDLDFFIAYTKMYPS